MMQAYVDISDIATSACRLSQSVRNNGLFE